MAGATSIVLYMGTLAIFLILLGPVSAITGYDCTDKIHNISTLPFTSLTVNEDSLQNVKLFALQHPNDFAYLFIRLPGHTTIVNEKKFSIVECKPVTVQIEPQKECYDQLPIVQGDQKLFMSPWTLIIANKANIISCDAPILKNYEVDGVNYKVIPKPVDPLLPKNLKYQTQMTWKYEEGSNPWESGIFPRDEIERAFENQQQPEKFNPPPRINFGFPDANGNVPGVIYHIKGTTKWYNDDTTLIIVIVAAIVGVILLAFIIKMIADRINHGSAFHLCRKCKRRRQTGFDQADLTIRLNNIPNV